MPMTFSRPLCWTVPAVAFPVTFAVALAVVLSSCGGEQSTTGQLKVTGLVTTCEPHDVACRTRPAEGAEVEVTRGDLVLTEVLNQDGAMWFSLDPGEYEVVVTLDGVSTEPSQVMLSPHQFVDLSMNLPKRTS